MATLIVILIEGWGCTHSTGGTKQQTMFVCNIGHGIQRFQGGVWNAAVVKFNFLCRPIHPTAGLWYKLVPLCGSVYQTVRPRLVFKSSFIFCKKLLTNQSLWQRVMWMLSGPFVVLWVLFFWFVESPGVLLYCYVKLSHTCLWMSGYMWPDVL